MFDGVYQIDVNGCHDWVSEDQKLLELLLYWFDIKTMKAQKKVYCLILLL